MNKIVVAIDFSECSINAFLHALSVAEHCHGQLILVWVDKSAGEKDRFNDKAKDVTKDVQIAFEDLIRKYQPEHPTVDIIWKIRKGKIYKEITDEAKQTKALMIITGTHGASGFEQFWIGSNANRIIAASSCPVITIRGGTNIRRALSKILLPIDNSEETRQKASFVAFLARHHDAEVFILKLHTSKLKAIRYRVNLYTEQVVEYFDKEGVRYLVEDLECDNITISTIDYARKIDANLIAIMTTQETTGTNIFHGTHAHQIVNQSPFPVLSIHPKETLTGGQGF